MQTSPLLKTGADKAARLTSVTAISFSLTFVGVSIALLAGFLPARVATLGGTVDTGVVLLFVPLCALARAIIAAVLRAVMKGQLRSGSTRRIRPLSQWRPGHGEG